MTRQRDRILFVLCILTSCSGGGSTSEDTGSGDTTPVETDDVGRETDEVSWWAGDDCVDGACSGQSRMPYRNGCAIDGYDFGQGDGFNRLALKDRMIELGVIINREQLYRIKIYLQKTPDEPAQMLAELWYEQEKDGRRPLVLPLEQIPTASRQAIIPATLSTATSGRGSVFLP